jgi:DNA-3-methyladenine glycosylase
VAAGARVGRDLGLGRRFFQRPSHVVAQAMLGKVLVRAMPGGTRLAARIVETEAYDESDPASHSFRGTTPRNAVMFGPAGHLYVYFTYGMHHCMNVVTGRTGSGSAVLLRAAEPVDGLESMAERRGTHDVRGLCSGPAKITQAFGIDRDLNGEDLVDGGRLWIERGRLSAPVVSDTRVGISSGTEVLWRFSVAGSPFVSRARGSGNAPPSSR